MASQKKVIKIKCEGTQYIDFHELNEFQEDIKSINQESLDKLKNSIKQGYKAPGFVWKYKNQYWILDMHQRKKALEQLEKEGWIIPKVPVVEIFAKTKKEAKQNVLLYVSQHGEVDEKKLQIYIKKYSIELKNIVIRTKTIDLKLGIKKETKDDDEVPVVEKNITKTGDLWELGRHRVLCGDNRIDNNIYKLMQKNLLNIVFTDPPYGVAIGDKNKLLDTIQKAERIKENIENDKLSPNKLKEELKKAFILIKCVSEIDCSYYVTAPQGGELGMMMMMMKESGLPVKHIIIWNKNKQCFSFGRLDYEYKHEPILFTWNKKHNFYKKGKYLNSVWDINKENKCDKHPTMKPIELIENALLNSSVENNICGDFYMGSGSTLIACEKINRICYGMEIDPHYCDVIIKRYIEWCKKNNIPVSVKRNGKLFDISRLANG